jgi:hypothetical protein
LGTNIKQELASWIDTEFDERKNYLAEMSVYGTLDSDDTSFIADTIKQILAKRIEEQKFDDKTELSWRNFFEKRDTRLREKWHGGTQITAD